jgi:hypothetical protein
VFVLHACAGAPVPSGSDGAPSSEPTGTVDAGSAEQDTLIVCIDAEVYRATKPVLDEFAAARPELEIGYNVLPNSKSKLDEFEQAAARLYTEVMGGGGPDVFILSSGYPTSNMDVFRVFADIEKVMRSGIFCDLSQIFETDDMSEDNFINPVLEAGRVDGKQFVVPLGYQLFSVVTNTSSGAIIDDSDKTAAGMLGQIGALYASVEMPARSALFSNIYERLMPYYFADIVDFEGKRAEIDTPFMREFLSIIKPLLAIERHAEITQGSGISDSYLEFARGEYFAVLANDLMGAADEAAVVAFAGAHPRIDVPVAQDGGARAIVSVFAAVSSASDMQNEAAELVASLLTRQAQIDFNMTTVSDLDGFPVRRGIMAERIARVGGQGFVFGAGVQKLAGEDVDMLAAVERRVTSACFPVPIELSNILGEYYNGALSLDECVSRMEQYWNQSLTE